MTPMNDVTEPLKTRAKAKNPGAKVTAKATKAPAKTVTAKAKSVAKIVKQDPTHPYAMVAVIKKGKKASAKVAKPALDAELATMAAIHNAAMAEMVEASTYAVPEPVPTEAEASQALPAEVEDAAFDQTAPEPVVEPEPELVAETAAVEPVKATKAAKPAKAEPADDKANTAPAKGANVMSWALAESGILPEPVAIPESNAPMRAHIAAMHAKAAAGDLEGVKSYLIGGTNTYSKLARNYRGALVRYLEVSKAA